LALAYGWSLKVFSACIPSHRIVSEPQHETTQGRPATTIRIPVVLCAAPGVKTKILSTKKKGPGCKHRSRSHGESGEVFSLDILSHRMSDMGIYHQSKIASGLPT